MQPSVLRRKFLSESVPDYCKEVRYNNMDRSESVVSDLRVTVEKPVLVHPAEATERHLMFLSHFDQTLMFKVETVHFFAAPSNGISLEEAAASVRRSLSRLLTHYEFMAGRVTFDRQQKRFQIDCNGAGALFAAASSELTIADLHDISYPNPSFTQLVLQLEDREELSKAMEDVPVCSLQVTGFKCGGLVIGLGTNHCVLDGLSAVDFVRNLAALAGGEDKRLAVVPFFDRTLLKGRSPPRIEYEHLEFMTGDEIARAFTNTVKLEDMNNDDNSIVFEIFHVSEEMMNGIKSKALQDGNLKNCTRFEALTAYLWQVRTIALEMPGGDMSWVLYAVDMRPRMKPPLPKGYAGNAVFPAYANATAKEIEQQPLSFCVQKLQEATARVSDSYIRSGIDWAETHKGVARMSTGEDESTSVFVSSWWRLGFENIEYPWGKPLYSGPVIHVRPDIVLFLPSRHHDGGVNVFLALRSHRMSIFQNLFPTLYSNPRAR